jgi:NADH:ubiquinone reductase (non-electrogenic)
MVGVVAGLTSCDFSRAGKEYADAVAAMESCGEGLAAGTPLVAMNAADRDLTMVAYDLGALIVGK